MEPNNYHRASITRVEDDNNSGKFDTNSVAGDGDGDRPSKRRRVALACNRCRKQKSRVRFARLSDCYIQLAGVGAVGN